MAGPLRQLQCGHDPFGSVAPELVNDSLHDFLAAVMPQESDTKIMSCSNCQAPQRLLWTFGKLPKLDEVETGNWNEIKRCTTCDGLWVSVTHEPCVAFEFLPYWPYDVPTWRGLNSRDNAKPIHEWHNAVIRENWQSLPENEKQLIEQWRIRTYRNYNPIDRGTDEKPPVYVASAMDIEALIRNE